MSAPAGGVLVAVPAYGRPDLTDSLLRELLAAPDRELVDTRIAVVDNRGDYRLPLRHRRVAVHRPGSNVRWIGAVNWALADAAAHGDAMCVVLNNDIHVSPGLLTHLRRAFAECSDVAVAAPCYDDFWLHQRAHTVPADAASYQPLEAYRSVPFCDGTALAFDVAVARRLGPLDSAAFPRHGYGADLDYAIRARAAGLRAVVTDAAYVNHLRRGTMNTLPQETSEQNRLEILSGMQAKWGDDWRALCGLGPGSFPPHNTGSAAQWYD